MCTIRLPACAALLAGALSGLITAAAAEPCLRVDQLVRGLPGLKEGEAVHQRLWIGRDRLRLDEILPDGAANPRHLLHADKEPPAIYELFPRTRKYRQWEELQNVQKDRTVYEVQILQALEKAPEDERKRVMAAYHLKEGLQRDVAVKREPSSPVTIGGTTYECQRLVVLENDLDVLDAIVTDGLPQAADYYRFYRHLGVFSDEVLAELKKVVGFPLRAQLRVLTGKLKKQYTLNIEVTAIGTAELERGFFDLPQGWLKEEKPTKEECAERDCENIVETANPTGGKFVDGRLGRTYYFCSRECKRKFQAEFKRGLPGRGSPSRAGEGTGEK